MPEDRDRPQAEGPKYFVKEVYVDQGDRKFEEHEDKPKRCLHVPHRLDLILGFSIPG